ncbi:hypothetical protein HG536_0C04770 [Torulaspora globosa]|uniref:Arf-GAP domain-containing protein n=1 Tax=Torulaspora globosa TaxID=48254 RepID=A0A7G3ZFM2_9SACH|nr:uncharacterized protein HG536_0C04770 [Torulaspora globosa]QLL32308.1 hypothetical protein HG536_0C04770 [Torulaspora globosa]
MSTAPPVKKALSGLLRDPKNNTCADCKAQSHPRWASWSLGVFICIKCAGTHRSLGTHISKVKSVDLDIWKEEHLEKLISLKNNDVANRYYEARLPESMRKPITDGSRLQLFIRNKYENKKWIGEQIPSINDKPAASASDSSKESVVSGSEPLTKQVSASNNLTSSTHSSLLNLQLSSAPKRTEETKRREEACGRPDLKKSILSLYSKAAHPNTNQSSLSSLSLSPAAPQAMSRNADSVKSLDDNELFKNVWST